MREEGHGLHYTSWKVSSISRLLRIAPLVLALLLVAAACSTTRPTVADADDADRSNLERFVEELKKDADEEQAAQLDAMLSQAQDLEMDGQAGAVSRDEARCIDRSAADAGLGSPADVFTDPELSESRKQLMEIFLDCIESPENFGPLVASIAATAEAVVGATFEVTDEQSVCVLRYVLETSSDPARTLVLLETPEDVDVMLTAFESCLTAEQMDTLQGAEGTGPQAYGDDSRLDRMYDECAAGDDRVCDLLYFVSAAGSDYAAITDDCAGRGLTPSGFCSPEVVLDETGFAAAESPGLSILSEDCEMGDNTACDLLFTIAPFGSEYENIGFTCGGRMAVGAIPDCRTRLG